MPCKDHHASESQNLFLKQEMREYAGIAKLSGLQAMVRILLHTTSILFRSQPPLPVSAMLLSKLGNSIGISLPVFS